FARREVVFFYLTWPAALYPTPVTARPPAGRAGKGRNFGTRCAGLPKLGDAPRPAPAKLALSGREVCFGRRSRSKHDWIFFPRLRAGKLCEACPAGRVYWTEGLDALQGSSRVQGLPLGGRTVRGTVRSGPGEATINHRCPSAHTGSDEGAIWYPTFRGLPAVASTKFFCCPVGQPGRPLISHLR